MSEYFTGSINVNVNVQPAGSAESGAINVTVLPPQDGGPGPAGPTGPQGKPGKSAYEIAVDNGFEGTEEEWLESLKGGAKNLADGTADGALRSVGSASETDDYKLGKNAVSLGQNTKAPGVGSLAEGAYAEAIGTAAHAEGSFVKAIADYTHAEGRGTIAASQDQHVQGKYNVRDAEGKYLHIVGNGVNQDQRKNAHTIDTEGNAWYSGDVFVGGAGQDDKNAEKLVKQSELDAISSESNKFFIIKLQTHPTSAGIYYHGYKYAEIKEAIDGGKAVILIDPNGKVYTLNYVLTAEAGANDNYFFHATAQYVLGQNANQLIADTLQISTDNFAFIYKTQLKAPSPRSLRIYDDSPKFIDEYDGSEAKQIYLPTELKNPYALHLRGAVNADYDGSTETTVNIPVGESTEGGTGGNASVFVVKVTYYIDHNDNGDENIYTADKTHAEIREAVERGDIVICELNYNYKANGATGSTGFNPLYLPYVTRSRNNLLCFAATFQNGFVFPYSGADSNHVVVTLDKNAEPDVYFKSFVHKSDLPLELPNPEYLVITQGKKRWDYNGFEEAKVDLDPPTTSLPWDKITDKPFGEDVPLYVTIDSTAFDGYLYTPFVLTAGTKYTISCKIGEMAFDFTDVTATEKNLEGINIVCLGNLHLLSEDFADTGEQYLIVNIPDGIYIGDNVYAYGLVMINGLTVPEGVTIALKIANPDGAKPIPEELIPTMSETTKGGAKVGKGLKMDGDTLTVDEGVYELIYDIVAEDESAFYIVENAPDGRQLDLSAAFVLVDLNGGEMSTSRTIAFYGETVANDTDATSNIASYSIPQSSGTKKITANCFLSHGSWDGEYTAPSANMLRTAPQRLYGLMNGKTEEFFPVIRRVATSRWPIGTLIKIYGVWKDA